jgi:acetyl-CoA carboxylase biotin carboxyl carrier protein
VRHFLFVVANPITLEPKSMLINQIKKLIKLVEESEIDEIEVSRWGNRIRIRKNPVSSEMPRASVVDGGPENPSPPDVGVGVTSEETSDVETKLEMVPAESTSDFIVRAPMVGTFYQSPAPDAPPFVEVGTKVTVGQTLCIIEAMKLMNELPSETNGVINKILVESGEPVEYGQELFWIGV